MARIVLMFGKKPERIIDLDLDELTVGRGSDALLDLDHDLVSRTHCRIRSVDGGFLVEDLGSKTGTSVNGAPVQRTMLADGDRISVGPWTLRFERPLSDSAPGDRSTREDLNDFWAQAAADSGMIGTVEDAETGPVVIDYAGVPRVAASGLRPDVSGPAMGDYKGTMLASADEMDRIRKSLEVSQEPHLTVRRKGRLEKLKLEDVTFEVGYFDDADYRLPGTKFFGKSQFVLRELDKGAWQVERSSFFAKVSVGGKPLKGVRPLRDGSVIAAAGLKFRFKLGA